MSRREFAKPVAVAITKRATINGVLRCEACFAAIAKGQIHHVVMDAMEVDKSRKLKPEDGQFLCARCHLEVTKKQSPVIAKAKRCEAAFLGVRTPPTLKGRRFPLATKPKRTPRAALPPRRLFEEARR